MKLETKVRIPHLCMQMSKVGGQVVDALRIQEAPDDVGRLQLAHRLAVLRHRCAIVATRVQSIACSAVDLRNDAWLCLWRT